MQNANEITGMSFIFLGLFNHRGTHLFHFSMVFLIFIISLMDNALIIVLIHMDTRPHTPMSFLLSQLSFMDMMLVLTIIPKMASIYLIHLSHWLWSTDLPVSYSGKWRVLPLYSNVLQLLCGHLLPTALLHSNESETMVAHDSRFLAFGRGDGLLQVGATLSFPYFHSQKINHFFCEAPSLVGLACADTMSFEFFMYVCCILMLLNPLSLTLVSYGHILSAVLCMQSTKARKKAFTTCSSHSAVLGPFYGTVMFIYIKLKSNHSMDRDKEVSAFYTILTPVLSPLIYSVRNKEVKVAFKKWFEKHFV